MVLHPMAKICLINPIPHCLTTYFFCSPWVHFLTTLNTRANPHLHQLISSLGPKCSPFSSHLEGLDCAQQWQLLQLERGSCQRMVATPHPTSSKKHSLSLSPPSVSEKTGSFHPEVL